MRAEKRVLPDAKPTFTNPHTVSRRCIVTSKVLTVTVERDHWDAWTHGKGSSKTLFPYLNDGEREFLISSLSPEGHEILFHESIGTDPEDDGDEEYPDV
jgi:hypothetical protein